MSILSFSFFYQLGLLKLFNSLTFYCLDFLKIHFLNEDLTLRKLDKTIFVAWENLYYISQQIRDCV